MLMSSDKQQYTPYGMTSITPVLMDLNQLNIAIWNLQKMGRDNQNVFNKTYSHFFQILVSLYIQILSLYVEKNSLASIIIARQIAELFLLTHQDFVNYAIIHIY
jgi:hypothetical protein